jgi:hypothetical protein
LRRTGSDNDQKKESGPQRITLSPF